MASYMCVCLVMLLGAAGISYTCSAADVTSSKLDVKIEYSSANSVRIQWRTSPEMTYHVARLRMQLLTHVELFVDNPHYICGHGNTVVIKSPVIYRGYYETVLSGVNSSSVLDVCIRVKVVNKWIPWQHIGVLPQARLPPLLTNEPPERELVSNVYRAYTTAIATPTASWRWVINGKSFNSTTSPKEARISWGITSPNRRTTHLQLANWHYVTYDSLRIYYEAVNCYGKVTSREIIIKKPYIKPVNCRRSEVTNIDITTPSGVVMTCHSYDDSYPDMAHRWRFCGVQSCDQQHLVGCRPVEETPGARLFVENGRRLVMTHVNQNDTGCYVCRSTNNAMRTTCLYETYLKVTSDDNEIIHPPRVIYRYPDVDTVQTMLYTALHLECLYQTHPTASVIWYHNNSIRIYNDLRHKLSADGAVLDISNVMFSDEGSYHCKVRQQNELYSDGGYFKVYVNVPVRIKHFQSASGFIGENITLFCDVTYSRSIEYRKNVDTVIKASDKYIISEDKKHLTIVNATNSDTATYSCTARSRYDSDRKHARVLVMEPPNISDIFVKGVSKTKDGATVYQLYCRYKTDANLMINLTWYIDENTCSNNVILKKTTRPDLANVTVSQAISSQLKCAVMCIGQSELKKSCREITLNQSERSISKESCIFSSQSVRLNVHNDPLGKPNINEVKDSSNVDISWISNNVYMLLGVSAVCGVIIITGSVIAIRHHRKNKARKKRVRSLIVEFRNDRAPVLERFASNSQYISSTDFDNIKNVLKDVEFPRHKLSLGEMVGRGQFGRVYKGTLSGFKCHNSSEKMTVAIKTLKYKSDEKDMVNMFLREAVMMKGFRHPHVLSLIGITFDPDSSPLVVLPYMENGDLRTYISNPDLFFCVRELLKMGQQVANGMTYLSKLKFVHRDLAARNCMVDKQGTVKVADFGLSRDIYHQEYYRIEEGNHSLPVRWMAPECLQEQVFTTKSDVWSYGVLLWELVTRGATPYPGIENWALIPHIKQGRRMQQPLFCPNSVYKLMMDCWHLVPKLRPSFEILEESLEDILCNAVTSDPSTSSPGRQRRSTLAMGIKTTRVTRVRTDSSVGELSAWAE